MDKPDWQRLGDYVVRRRIELGYRSQFALEKASGISYRTISRVETGGSVRRSTLLTLERALRWELGSCDKILAGGDPVSLPLDEQPGDLRADPDYQKWLAGYRRLRAKGVGRDEALAALTEEDQPAAGKVDDSRTRRDAR